MSDTLGLAAERYVPQPSVADQHDLLLAETRLAMAGLHTTAETVTDDANVQEQEEVSIKDDRRTSPKAIRRSKAHGQGST